MKKTFVALLLTLLAGSAARAQTVVLLPAAGDAALQVFREQAQDVLEEALGGQGLRVQRHGDFVSTLTGPGAACRSVDCAAALLRDGGADLAAALRLWAAADEGGPPMPGIVFVTLVDRNGERYPGKSELASKGLAIATREAMFEARALHLLGPGPWLRVTGEPQGAEVLVDGQSAGALPLRMRVAPGRHTLQIRHVAHRTHVQSVEVPPNAARQLELQVKLVTRPEEAPESAGTAVDAAADLPDGEDLGRPVVGPLIFGAAGAGFVVYDIVLLAQSGCERRELGVCTKRNRVNEEPAIAFGVLGVGALAGGLLWFLLGGEGDAGQAILLPQPGGLAARATF